MSAHMKMHHINNDKACRIIIDFPGEKKKLCLVPVKYYYKLEAFLEKYSESDSTRWEEIASKRIAKHKKSGLALRGARYREGFSQKALAKKTGISQENLSKMENGKRKIGTRVAKKLATVLHIDHELLIQE